MSCNYSLLNTDVPKGMKVYGVHDITKELSKGGDEFHQEEMFEDLLPQQLQCRDTQTQFKKVSGQVLHKGNCNEKILKENNLTYLGGTGQIVEYTEKIEQGLKSLFSVSMKSIHTVHVTEEQQFVEESTPASSERPTARWWG